MEREHPIIIALVGMSGSGKSEAAAFFKDKGLPVLRFGDAVQQEVERRGLTVNEDNERLVREELRQGGMRMGAIAELMDPLIEEQLKTEAIIVVDGLYSESERRYLINKFPFLTILCIFAPPEVRYERLAKRKVRPLTEEEARSRDEAEIDKLEKGGPIAMANHLIKNEGSKEDLLQQLEEFFSKL